MRLGIDIGGTAVKLGIVNDSNRVIDSRTIPTDADRPVEAILTDIATTAPPRALLTERPASSTKLWKTVPPPWSPPSRPTLSPRSWRASTSPPRPASPTISTNKISNHKNSTRTFRSGAILLQI